MYMSDAAHRRDLKLILVFYLQTWSHMSLAIDNWGFPKLFKFDSVANQGLQAEEKNKFSKELPAVGIEPRTSHDPLWFLTELCFMYNFTFWTWVI